MPPYGTGSRNRTDVAQLMRLSGIPTFFPVYEKPLGPRNTRGQTCYFNPGARRHPEYDRNWVRRPDSNRRPQGNGPCELPAAPLRHVFWHISQTLEVPLAMPDRRAPDRLAALLSAFRLIYRILPTSDFHGWARPNLRPYLFYPRRVLRRDLPKG